MLRPKIRYMIPVFLVAALIAGFYLLSTPTKTSAQCGSQASSCKNCHEVQGQDPVNNDGTSWHSSHAFGDFCYICHGGNSQATDETAAHTGMVAPLADIQASCIQCHPNDLQERAQVYATALGVTIGEVGSIPSTPTTTTVTQTVSTATYPCVLSGTELAVNDPNLVDYTQRYSEIVLGKKPVNWGNIILIGLIGMVAIGGGGFVVVREKLVKFSFGDTKKVEGEYPADAVEMLPRISRVSSAGRKTLSRVLENPKKAEKVLGLIDAVISSDEEHENSYEIRPEIHP
jgi:hypothetical protein